MLLARLLQIDLAGRIAFWKRKYKSDHREFDHRRIYCSITKWSPEAYSVSASAYCADPLVTEGSSTTLRLYRTSAKFRSRVEAEAHLEGQVRAASRRHPMSRFYRQFFLDDPKPRIGPPPKVPMEIYDGGVWKVTSEMPTAVCPACGASVNGPVCPSCGEQFYS